MKSLLRFQGVVLARTHASGLVRLFLGGALVAVVLAEWRGPAGMPSALAIPFLYLAGMLGVIGIASTYDALDALRWSAPVRPSEVLKAHIVFWTAICSALALAFAAAVGWRSGAETGVLVFVDLMLVAGTVAFVVPYFHGLYRRRSVERAALASLLAIVWLFAPGTWGVALMCNGEPALAALVLTAVLAASATFGTRSVLRDERLPVASGAADLRLVAPPQTKPRDAARTARAQMDPGAAWVVAAFVVLFFLVPTWTWFPFPVLFLPIAVRNLTTASLPSCRWLFATPMDRSRMFRRVLGPVVLLVVGATAARFVEFEFQPNRTAFFRMIRQGGYPPHRNDAVSIGQLWDVDEARHEYRPPDINVITTHLSEHLREIYGAEIPADRIEASIRRGWPSPGPGLSNDSSYAWQEAFFDAMDRVRADLGDDLIAAERRRNLIFATAVVLLGVGALCAAVGDGRRARFRTVFMLAFAIVCLVPLGIRGTRAAEVMHAVSDVFERPLQRASTLLFALSIAGAGVVAFLLWKLAERSFRRLDLTDLPPSTTGVVRRTSAA